jgi:hypothetical protein
MPQGKVASLRRALRKVEAEPGSVLSAENPGTLQKTVSFGCGTKQNRGNRPEVPRWPKEKAVVRVWNATAREKEKNVVHTW